VLLRIEHFKFGFVKPSLAIIAQSLRIISTILKFSSTISRVSIAWGWPSEMMLWGYQCAFHVILFSRKEERDCIGRRLE